MSKLAAFQLVNGRTLVGRTDPDVANPKEPSPNEVYIVDNPHEFAFVRGSGGQPTPAMMPFSVIPHVGEPLEMLPLFSHHVVAWEWASAEIEALYVHVTTGIDLASGSTGTPKGILEIPRR